MGESRKSDYTGDVFGDWTVIGRGEGEGDRKRRWVVNNNETGVQMTVLQTGLTDLALAKRLADKASADDGARYPCGGRDNPPCAPLSPEQAEEQLLLRLDRQIQHTMLLEEARASVALDNDPECGTYTIEGATWVIPTHPFNDYEVLADQQVAAGDPFGLSPTTLALIADRGRCLDCEDGMHPEIPPYLEHQVEAIEAQLSAALQDATGDPSLTVVYDRRPLMASGPGAQLEPVTVSLSEEFKGRLYDIGVHIETARKALDRAETRLCDILEEMLP